MRIINLDNPGKDRNIYSKDLAISLIEIKKFNSLQEDSLEVAAFIALMLFQIWETVDISVTAWEKRGYWLKADKFRMEWLWAHQNALAISRYILDKDWQGIVKVIWKIESLLGDIKISKARRSSKPWIGAIPLFDSKTQKLKLINGVGE